MEYRKYGNMSNLREYYMLWLEPEMLFADITWEKPNIRPIEIIVKTTLETCDIIKYHKLPQSTDT